MYSIRDEEMEELKSLIDFEKNPKAFELLDKISERKLKRSDYMAKYMAEKRKVDKNNGK